jgi:hypothetical protein
MEEANEEWEHGQSWTEAGWGGAAGQGLGEQLQAVLMDAERAQGVRR